MSNANDIISVAVAVCTYQRPVMLLQCVRSIIAQAAPANWRLTVLVVENNAVPESAKAVAELNDSSMWAIKHIWEPERGISSARNAALNAAVALQADWLLFIDDDEEADDGLLLAYADAIGRYEAEVIHGKVNYRYQTASRWNDLLDDRSRRADGRRVRSAATDNVMISKKIFAEWALRFEPALSFSGGEDTEFFNHARLRGARIVATSKPSVSTTVQSERDNLRWIFRREKRIGASGVYIDAKHHGKMKAIKKHVVRGLRNVLHGLRHLLLSVFVCVFARQNARRHLLIAVQQMGRGCGGLIGVFGKLPQPYHATDGH